MNFFEAQKSAKRHTSILILLFAIAVASLLLLSNIILAELDYYLVNYRLSFSIAELATTYKQDTAILLSMLIIGFVGLGSFYKLFMLRGGGASIAQQLGGIIIPRNTSNPLYKKILNVVEEMAIASGTAVPQVFILNEQGINAFAAGWKTTNAVIGITQGAVEQLSRDELQGVIAHEFSHIFNGDMRLNIRLIAILHGILMVGLLGRFILRGMRFVGRSKNSKGGGQAVIFIVVAGVSLFIIGYVGTFVGNIIKASISRQREYLADASAVQFTRNNLGLADALKKIGGAVSGSALLAANVEEYSHAYFAMATNPLSFFSLATHPPLTSRITRLQPNWNGKFLAEKKIIKKPSSSTTKADAQQHKQKIVTDILTSLGAGMSFKQALGAVENIGDITQPNISNARWWQQELSEEIKSHADNPFGAQTIILTLLLANNKETAQQQVIKIAKGMGIAYQKTINKLQPQLKPLIKTQAVSLIELTMPSLREMNLSQYKLFERHVQKLIIEDKKIDLREWVIQRMVLQQLQQEYGIRKKKISTYFVLGSAKKASEAVLSILTYLEHNEKTQAEKAFNSAKRAIGAEALQLQAENTVSLKTLNQAVDELERLKPHLKKRFIQACVHCISYNGKVTVPAFEVCRAIASCLDCPMPPILMAKNVR